MNNKARKHQQQRVSYEVELKADFDKQLRHHLLV